MKLKQTHTSLIIGILFFFNYVFSGSIQLLFFVAPFMLFFLIKNKQWEQLVLPFFIFGLFSIFHLHDGVLLKDFVVSHAIIGMVVIITISFFNFYRNSDYINDLFYLLAIINIILTVIAIFSIYFGVFISKFWYLIPFTAGYESIPRLKLFFLEASHYSFALLPIFYYYFFKSIKGKKQKDILLLSSVIISLLLSFSLGVWAVIGISTFLVMSIKIKSLLRFMETRKSILFLLGSAMVVFLLFYFIFPDNPLFFRIHNFFNGNDTSGRGRTYEAFEIAWLVLEQNNPFVGIGLGQFKSTGRDVLLNYYKFTNTPEVARLPNAMAETLVVYGILGFSLKLFIQLYLFFKLKVKDNMFQLTLFITLFLYQFTGSFMVHIMEYVLWVLAFYPKLDYFSIKSYFKK